MTKTKDVRAVHRPFFAWREWLYNEFWLRRWWFKDLNLIVQWYDDNEDYTQWYMRCARRFLPKRAVHISKRKGWFFLDLCSKEKYPTPINYEECSASDIFSFKKNNTITDAVKMAGTLQEPLNMKKVLTYGIVAIIIVVIAWSIIGGR